MKFIVTFIFATMLASAGAFANDVSADRYGDRPADPRGHADDIFLAEVPAGAKKARKDDRVMGFKVDELVGTTIVRQQTDEEIGKVKDVIVDGGGNPVALVMNVHEQPGITSRDVAVDWRAVHSERDERDRVVVNVDVAIDQLMHAPEFATGS